MTHRFQFACRVVVTCLLLHCRDADLLASETHVVADAVQAGDWSRVDQLLRNGHDAKLPQADGMTALHWAVLKHDAKATRRLLQEKVDVNAVTRYQVTPLEIACTAGDTEIVQLLVVAGANVQAKAIGSESMLHIAARTGLVEATQALIDADANVDELDGRGQTPLMWAAAAGNTDVVSQLVEYGADANISLTSGFTALMFAARQGKIGAAMRLLDAGVEVNYAMNPKRTGGRSPRDGMSALMLAVESGHFELAIKLVDRGADPNDERSEFTPLHAVVWTRKSDRGDNVSGDPIPRGSGSLTSLDFVREIVSRGADVNRKLRRGSAGRAKLNLRGATPFLMAAKTADLPLMKLLLELDADISLTNIVETTPLMATAGVGVTAVGEEAGTEPEVLEALAWLVEQGIDINAVDENGETAMHGAAYRNYPLAVELLANLGADPVIWNNKNKYGWTPTMIAAGHRPGSFKPSPETIAALEAALLRK